MPLNTSKNTPDQNELSDIITRDEMHPKMKRKGKIEKQIETYQNKTSEIISQTREKKDYQFEDIYEISKRLTKLQQEIFDYKSKKDVILKDIRILKRDIDESNRTIIGKFINLFRLIRTKKELTNKEILKEEIIKKLAEFEQLFTQLSDLKDIQNNFDEDQKYFVSLVQDELEKKEPKGLTKEIRIKEAKEKEETKVLEIGKPKDTEKLEKEIEGKKIRNVKRLSLATNAVFLHSIRPDYTPRHNSPLNNSADWDKKMIITALFEPTIPTSTLREGDTYEYMFGRTGFIIGEGQVEKAYPSDAMTIIEDNSGRAGKNEVKELPVHMIKPSIVSRLLEKRSLYNELVVSSPKICGIYVCPEIDSDGSNYDIVEAQKVKDMSLLLGIPIYLIIKGEIFNAQYSEDGTNYIVDANKLEKVKLKDIIETTYSIDDNKKTELKEKLLNESPFKFNNKEIFYLKSRELGKRAPLGFIAQEDGNKLPVIDEKRFEQKPWIPKSLQNKNYQVFYKFNGAGFEYELIKIEGEEKLKLKKQSSAPSIDYTQSNPRYTSEVTFEDVEPLARQDHLPSLPIGGTRGFVQSYELFTSAGYIKKIQRILEEDALSLSKLENNEKLKQEYGEEYFLKQLEFYKNLINELAFHLLGMAETAKDLGNDDIALHASEAAFKYITKDEYLDIIKRREGKNGHFKMTDEELNEVLERLSKEKKKNETTS